MSSVKRFSCSDFFQKKTNFVCSVFSLSFLQNITIINGKWIISSHDVYSYHYENEEWWQSKLRNKYFNFIIMHEKYGDFQHKQRKKKTTER